MARQPLVLLLLLSSTTLSVSFQMPNFFGSSKKVTIPSPSKAITSLPLKNNLIQAISGTQNGKAATPEQQAKVLNIAREMELKFPTSPELLSNENEAALIDGTWYLQYTSPSEVEGVDATWKPEYAKEGESNIETARFNAKGSVSASGIEVDTSNRVVKQIIDTTNKMVTNDITLDWGRVVVGGSFRQSEKVPNRAVVKFDTANITPTNFPTLKLGFLFDAINFVRNQKENGWLETTYIDDTLRIGRGNKGTLFVLTRQVDAVKP